MHNKKKRTCGEIVLDEFLSLPRRAQAMFFEVMENGTVDTAVSGEDINPYYQFSMSSAFDTDGCNSPIEKIMRMALNISAFKHGFLIENQYEITSVSGKKYRADFAIIHLDEEDNENVIVLVECDGHEYHNKTKIQVKRDNERDMDIKLSGYEVLHFSGSQIYENPFKCAEDVSKYYLSKVKKDE